MQEAAIGPALKINFDLRKDVRANLWPKTRPAVTGEHKSGE
jgi:hypothetical protein